MEGRSDRRPRGGGRLVDAARHGHRRSIRGDPADPRHGRGHRESAGVKLESVLLQARDVGAALVDEAVEREADVLVVGLAYRTKFGGDFAMGRTIPYILKNAPCAVWVVREPIPEDIK
jgi:nucleotide-binding universal stress UspA family protein